MFRKKPQQPLPKVVGQNAQQTYVAPAKNNGFLDTILAQPTRLAPSDPGSPPSLSVNNPMETPTDVLSTVDPDTATTPHEGVRVLRPQNPVTDLLALRCRYPHLPILPFPNSVKTVALQPGVPADIGIPDTAVLLRFTGNGEYYVSINGAASVPANALDDTSAQACTSVHKPEGVFYYMAGVNQVSLVSPQETIVTLHFYNG